MKVSIIGSGAVGSQAAFLLMHKNIVDEIMLIDIVKGLPQGKALDIGHSAPIDNSTTKILGSNEYSSLTSSEIVVITAGLPRKDGMTRDDLLMKNTEIIKGIVSEVKKYAPGSIIIMVTNPLDVMAYAAFKISGFSDIRVIGMAGILDSARYRYYLKNHTRTDSHDIKAMVLGTHGDGMIPLFDHCTIGNERCSDTLKKEELEKISKKTVDSGAEVIALTKQSTIYAPAASIVKMVEAIVKDTKEVFPCSVYLTGQYGIEDVYLGVPVRLGRKGAEEIVELDLTPEEEKRLKETAQDIAGMIKTLRENNYKI